MTPAVPGKLINYQNVPPRWPLIILIVKSYCSYSVVPSEMRVVPGLAED